MRLSISEARRRLPELVRRLKRGGQSSVEITVHDEVVAELRRPRGEPEPGVAVDKLLEAMSKLPRVTARKRNVSGNVKQVLYGRRA